jgi:ppGpp synthetase/RelA/SpoT-type nucleotidyltranferase
MKKREADRILVEYFSSQTRYERLARELHRLLDEHPTFPTEAVYTVKHRLKNPNRLIEKIASSNDQLRKGRVAIDHTNFRVRINDLLGIRIVSLRLADLEKLKAYLSSLRDEKKLVFIQGPSEKRTFLIRPIDDAAADMQYSGYSSIHYVVKLGAALRPPKELSNLRAELQLRTILEEAWGEIDHRYRYELTRRGKQVPSHVETGFRDLGLYLQAAARQADHICEELDHANLKPQKKSRRRRKTQRIEKNEVSATTPPQTAPPETIVDVLQRIVGFTPTTRTLAYIERRLKEHAIYRAFVEGTPGPFTPGDFRQALNPSVIDRFRKVYRDAFNAEPFTDASEWDLDVIPLVNFALFSTYQSSATAEAGLRAALRSRYYGRGYVG